MTSAGQWPWSRKRSQTAEALFASAKRAALDTPDESTIRAAIDAGDEVLNHLSSDSREFTNVLLNVCTLYAALWHRSADEDDWRSWGLLMDRRLSAMSQERWRAVVASHVLARMYYNRVLVTGAEEDRNNAIEALERARARDLGPEAGAMTVAALGRVKLMRYSEERDPADLEEAIRDGFTAAKAEGANEAVRHIAVLTLCRGLVLRGDATYSAADLTAALEFGESLLRDRRFGDEGLRAEAKALVAGLLRLRFRSSGECRDIARAIVLRRQLVSGSSSDEERAIALDNLGNALHDRFLAYRSARDLEHALAASEKALALIGDEAPSAGRISANIAVSLQERFEASRERSDSQKALAYFHKALATSALDHEKAARLHGAMGRHLLMLSAVSASGTDLDNSIVQLRIALQFGLESEDRLPVIYRLGRYERLGTVSRMLTGALLRRAATSARDAAEKDRLEALAVAEATKSPILLQALMHRTQVEDPDSARGFEEGYELSLLDALDAAELAMGGGPIRTDRQMEWIVRRQRLQQSLTARWADSAARSPDMADRVSAIKYPISLLEESVGTRDELELLLSICDFEDFDASGSHVRGVCAILSAEAGKPLDVLFSSDRDPFPGASGMLQHEIPEDAGRGKATESWHLAIREFLPAQAVREGYQVVVSPSATSSSLPWALVLERCGWATEDNSPLAVLTVPSLMILALPEPNRRWHTPLDLAELTGYDDVGDLSQPGASVSGLLFSLVNPSADPVALVVGNPTGNLPAAEREAVHVADIYQVAPLIGDEASTAHVLGQLSASDLVHVAAHAKFEPDAPLESYVRFADGLLPARRLLGSSLRARLVVLSACQAAGGATLIGTEVLGLVSALVRAGTEAVVASVWSVDDASSSFLMRRFHRYVAEGMEPPRALAEAQAYVRRQSGWSAPYYWAGFVVMGHSKPRAKRGGPSIAPTDQRN